MLSTKMKKFLKIFEKKVLPLTIFYRLLTILSAKSVFPVNPVSFMLFIPDTQYTERSTQNE